jgi:integrase
VATVRKRTWQSGEEMKTAWIADYANRDGKRHIRTFKTKREATAFLADTQHEIKRGIHTPSSKSITVAEAGEAWIAQAEADGLERSTTSQYRRHLNLHIKPLIGDLKLAELSPHDIHRFRADLGKTRSRAMVSKVTSSLSSILAEATARGNVARNVVRDQTAASIRRHTRIAKRNEKRLEVGVDIPSKDEIRAILAAAEGRWRALLVTAVFAGLRASELRGLTWDAVDLDKAVLTVRQRADFWGSIGSPKSEAGRRDVPLAEIVVKTLREWKVACPPGSLVFPNTKGKVLQLANIHYRGLAKVQHAAGVSADPRRPKYGLHAFRHAAASLFIEQGFPPKRVQEIMGHASIKMTLDVYGHTFPAPGDDRAALRALQARLLG